MWAQMGPTPGPNLSDKFDLGSLWMCSSRDADHFAGLGTQNDLIFDPFMGSGTTAKMALINNRNFIGCEISSDYVAIANKRLEAVQGSLF